MIATGVPVIVSYDLADDSIWGLGLGCSGAVDIRIERLEDDPITRDVVGDPRARGAAVLVTPLSGVVGPDDRWRRGRSPGDLPMPHRAGGGRACA